MEPFIITGDLQIKPWQQFSHIRKDGMNSRLYYCLKVFDIILETAKERGIRRVFLNGDFFEENSWIETETYDAAYRKLDKLHEAGLETVISLGNHDVFAKLSGRMLHPLRAFSKVARILEKPELIWDCVQVVPWMENPQKLIKAISKVAASPRRILVLHCGVQGAVAGPTRHLIRNPIQLRDIRHKEFGLVLLSDYHTRQRLAPNVAYLGSPLQHSFGETHKPCIWIISNKRYHFRMDKVFTNLPRFRRVVVSSPSDLYARTDWRGDYVSIKPSAELSHQEVQKVADKMGFKFKIEHGEEEVSVPVGTSHVSPKHGIRKFVRQQNLPAPEMRRLIKLGFRLYG
jgi:DNA repair exonuclease SbcCD nuclease subunit